MIICIFVVVTVAILAQGIELSSQELLFLKTRKLKHTYLIVHVSFYV